MSVSLYPAAPHPSPLLHWGPLLCCPSTPISLTPPFPPPYFLSILAASWIPPHYPPQGPPSHCSPGTSPPPLSGRPCPIAQRSLDGLGEEGAGTRKMGQGRSERQERMRTLAHWQGHPPTPRGSSSPGGRVQGGPLLGGAWQPGHAPSIRSRSPLGGLLQLAAEVNVSSRVALGVSSRGTPILVLKRCSTLLGHISLLSG